VPGLSLYRFPSLRIPAIRIHAGVASGRAHDVRFAISLGMIHLLSHVVSVVGIRGKCSDPGRFLLGDVRVAKSLSPGTRPP